MGPKEIKYELQLVLEPVHAGWAVVAEGPTWVVAPQGSFDTEVDGSTDGEVNIVCNRELTGEMFLKLDLQKLISWV